MADTNLFDGTQREVSGSPVLLPIISNGQDISAILRVMRPFAMAVFDACDRGEINEMDNEAINAELARLPERPDDNLT